MFLKELSFINQLIKNNNMYRKYQTNQQAWDEVTRNYNESLRRTEICKEMFGQENLKGLTDEQRESFWKAV
jgi:superfamily II helicase